MALSESEFEDILAEGHKVKSSEATALTLELAGEPVFNLGIGQDFGQGMTFTISNAAQKIKDMDVSQRNTFGSQVSTLVISENPGGDPGT